MNKIINFKKDEGILSKLKTIDYKKNYSLILLLVFGIILLLFSDLFTVEETKSFEEEIDSVEKIALEHEKKLTELIARVDGAGKAEIMITMESSGETIYAKTQAGDEQVSSDGDNTDTKTGYSTEYIIVEDENGNKTALVENEYEPVILGVAVLCEGGDSVEIVSEITELVKVVMGVTSNRVYVGKLTGD